MKSRNNTNPSIQEIKRKAAPVFKKYGVKKAALFGSIVHGTMTKKSDVDILVELDPKLRLGFEFVGMKFDLEEKTQRKVDLVTYKALHPFLREKILNDQKIIYERKRT